MTFTSRPLMERFWEKIEKTERCWNWKGHKNDGYGRIGSGGHSGKQLSAHRLAYEILIGPIPEGLQVDHLCRNRACVNPHHMELVTIKENIMRGMAPAAQNKRKTFCIRGHPLNSDNLVEGVLLRTGKRKCKICERDYQRRYAFATYNPVGRERGEMGR